MKERLRNWSSRSNNNLVVVMARKDAALCDSCEAAKKIKVGVRVV